MKLMPNLPETSLLIENIKISYNITRIKEKIEQRWLRLVPCIKSRSEFKKLLLFE